MSALGRLAGMDVVFSEHAIEARDCCDVPKFSRHRSKRLRKKIGERLHRRFNDPAMWQLSLPGQRPRLVVHPALKAQLFAALHPAKENETK